MNREAANYEPTDAAVERAARVIDPTAWKIDSDGHSVEQSHATELKRIARAALQAASPNPAAAPKEER